MIDDYPEPHTSPWLEIMMERDTGKALHTMAIIRATNGDHKVCGICGDKPAFDFPLIDWDEFPIRLCSDCREIREAEPYREVYGTGRAVI